MDTRDRPTPDGVSKATVNDRLDSWKEIAAYLKRDERTVRRWQAEGLPVHRHLHKKKAAIYAYKAEIDAWWTNGHDRLEQQDPSVIAAQQRDCFIASVQDPNDVHGSGSLSRQEVSIRQAVSQNAVRMRGTRGLIYAGITGAVLALAAGGGYLFWSSTRSQTIVPTPSLTRLTWDSGLTTDPALSPDGRLLAYASDRSDEGHLDIYLQQVGGSNPLRLTSGPGDKREPAFSPDGITVAYDSADGGIYLVSTLGGTSRQLVSEGHGPRFSPDGKWIAYSKGTIHGASLNSGDTGVFVVASAGGVPRQVRPDFAGAIYPLWSPDGRHLLFLGNADNRKSPEESIDWWATLAAGGPAVKTGVLEATRRGNLASDFQGYPWALVPGNWEPDGKGIVFSARSGDSVNLWRIGISATTFKVAGPPIRLTYGLAREEIPAVVAERNHGIRVAFASITDNLAVWSLPIKPNEGRVIGEPQQLAHDAAGDFMPDVSRDGNRVAFVKVRPGNQEVWIKDLQNGQEFALTATREKKYEPVLSPDGSLVSFSEYPPGNIYIVPSTGGAVEMLLEGGGEATDWSADGKRILGNTVEGRAWLLDLASRRRTDLLATDHWIATDAFSPDNRWFSFLDVKHRFRRACIAPLRDQPVPESAWISVGEGEAFTWSPDGNLLYAASERDGHLCIWAQRLQPSTKRPLGAPFAVFHSHNARLSLTNQTEMTLSIGGNKLVFSMGERTGNIWLADWKEW